MTATRTAPLYEQLARRIAGEVMSGLEPGTRLPSERVLCERLGVSRVTLRSALAMLEHEGTVRASAARGWFVAGHRRPQPLATVLGFTENAAARGMVTSARVLESTVRPATLDEADTFGIVPGSPVFELRRLRYLNDLVIAVDQEPGAGRPVSWHRRAKFFTESLYRVLRQAPEPVVATVADYAVEAVPAQPDEAALLELPPGMPLLVASQRTFDQFGRTFELGVTRYRGDRFRFRASLGVQGSGTPGVSGFRPRR